MPFCWLALVLSLSSSLSLSSLITSYYTLYLSFNTHTLFFFLAFWNFQTISLHTLNNSRFPSFLLFEYFFFACCNYPMFQFFFIFFVHYHLWPCKGTIFILRGLRLWEKKRLSWKCLDHFFGSWVYVDWLVEVLWVFLGLLVLWVFGQPLWCNLVVHIWSFWRVKKVEDFSRVYGWLGMPPFHFFFCCWFIGIIVVEFELKDS